MVIRATLCRARLTTPALVRINPSIGLPRPGLHLYHTMSKEELNEDWKFKDPYKIHESGSFNPLYEGECHCGKVKYQLNRERPLQAKFCHCTTCHRLHGAAPQWAAVFHKQDINFIHGHEHLCWYDPSSQTVRHDLPCKVSCEYCRTPIMDEGRNMILLYPGLIKFKSNKDRMKFYPDRHIFYGTRVMDIKDGTPKWSGLDEKSERMDE